MTAPIDSAWSNNVLSDGNLNQTTYGQGTSMPSTWSTTRLFWRTDEKKIYQNTGTEGSPTWTELGGGAELHTITTGGAVVNPAKQTGTTSLIIDNTDGTAGGINVIVDGSSIQYLTTGQNSTRILNPSSSLQISSSGTWNFGANTTTQYSGKPSGSPSDFSTCWGFDTNDSGTKLFMHGYYHYFGSRDRTRVWSLSTAFDPTTASQTEEHNFGRRYGMFYVNSTKILFGNDSGSTISLKNLGSADSFNTISSSSDFDTGLSNPRGVGLFDSGTLLACSPNSGYTKFWDLTTPYDLTTATNGRTYSDFGGNIKAMQFTTSGDLFATWASGTIRVYECSTNFDPSTATLQSTNSVGGGTNGGCIKRETIRRCLDGHVNSYTYDPPFTGTCNLQVS